MCFYAMMTLTQSNKLRTKIRKERNSVFKIALHIVKKRKQILFTRKMPKQNKKESEKKRNPSELNALERNERLRIKNLEIKIKQEEKKRCRPFWQYFQLLLSTFAVLNLVRCWLLTSSFTANPKTDRRKQTTIKTKKKSKKVGSCARRTWNKRWINSIAFWEKKMKFHFERQKISERIFRLACCIFEHFKCVIELRSSSSNNADNLKEQN